MDKGKKINWKNGLLLSAVSYLFGAEQGIVFLTNFST